MNQPIAVKELIVHLKEIFLFNYGGCFIHTMSDVELSRQIVIELQPHYNVQGLHKLCLFPSES